ncbi:MAG: hypothetical protein HY033_00315 [Ignavibacteriae bacterium]|nr:hypothetical protein [Ignavibacteriota bacterium]
MLGCLQGTGWQGKSQIACDADNMCGREIVDFTGATVLRTPVMLRSANVSIRRSFAKEGSNAYTEHAARARERACRAIERCSSAIEHCSPAIEHCKVMHGFC